MADKRAAARSFVISGEFCVQRFLLFTPEYLFYDSLSRLELFYSSFSRTHMGRVFKRINFIANSWTFIDI